MRAFPPQRISFITLGVKDLTASKAFYLEKFGWKPQENQSDGIVFFEMNGLILSLFSADDLAEDAGIVNNGSGFKRISLSINCISENEVDEVFAGFRERGVRIVKAPQKVFWGGYSGYAADNEDNFWEFAFNPFIALDAAGNIVPPEK